MSQSTQFVKAIDELSNNILALEGFRTLFARAYPAEENTGDGNVWGLIAQIVDDFKRTEEKLNHIRKDTQTA